MDTVNYDFESKLEQGFKTLFNTAGIALFIADDVDGELPSENVRLELTVGGVISSEHLRDNSIYDNYGGSLEVVIETPRVSSDQVAITEGEGAEVDAYIVSGAGTDIVDGTYVRNGESIDGRPAYTMYDTGGSTALYNLFWLEGAWYITSTDINDILAFTESSYAAESLGQHPPESGWLVNEFRAIAPAPTLAQAQSTPLQFKSRHAELVAIARKTLEEIDAAAITTNWPDALAPTKIKPIGTERENDAESRMTTLSYELQFRIA